MSEGDEAEEVSCPTCNGTGRVKPAGEEAGSRGDRLFSGKPIRVMSLRKPRE